MTLLLVLFVWLMVGCATAWVIGKALNAFDLGSLPESTNPNHPDADFAAIQAATPKFRTAGFPHHLSR